MLNKQQAKKFDILTEVILLALLLPGLVVINLPIVPTPEPKIILYMVALLTLVFTFVWHRWKLPISEDLKNFIEASVDISAVSLIVHFTGGVSSYFNFLYVLPTLHVATTSNKFYTLGVVIIAGVFIMGEALIFPQLPIKPFAGLSNHYSLAAITSISVGLIAGYGRYLSHESQSSQGALVASGLEREKSINKLKDEFVFIISHELRGPITAIRGYLDLFLSGAKKTPEIPSEVINLAKNAFKQGDKLNNLISELLDLSRLETNKFKLTSEKIEINSFIKDLVSEFSVEAEEKKIKLSFSPSKEPLGIETDKERLREVVSNLLDNALKYTGEFGQVLVWSEVRDGQAYISVADTGVGIPSEELPFIFVRFYQPVSTETSNDKSRHVGIGLYLAKNLLERMGGGITVDSRLGKGTKFTFYLPLAKNRG